MKTETFIGYSCFLFEHWNSRHSSDIDACSLLIGLQLHRHRLQSTYQAYVTVFNSTGVNHDNYIITAHIGNTSTLCIGLGR